jgi:hypothetical protein
MDVKFNSFFSDSELDEIIKWLPDPDNNISVAQKIVDKIKYYDPNCKYSMNEIYEYILKHKIQGFLNADRNGLDFFISIIVIRALDGSLKLI